MIKRIKICDFKSIRELDLNLDPVTVLVGRGGTGKSNLVQALRFLRNLLIDHPQAINYEGGWQRIVPVGEKNPTTSVEAVFSMPGEGQDYTYRTVFGTRHGQQFAGTLELITEHLALGNEMLFSRSWSPRGWDWPKAPDIAVMPHPSDSPMLGSFPSLQKVVFAYAGLTSGIGYYHFPSTTLGPATQPRGGDEFLRPIPGLLDNATNYLQIIRDITRDFHRPNVRKSLVATLQAVNPTIESVELDSLTHPQRAVVGHAAAGRVFELSLEQESDGLRRFYAHLLALYQTPPKLTLVFEEPENAIFPGALSLLADEFKAAPGESRGQVILTTHNPILLDSFDVDHVRVVEMREGKTVVGPVSKEQRDAVRDQLLTTGDLLTVEHPRAENAPIAEQVA
jgi:hypothetical protein